MPSGNFMLATSNGDLHYVYLWNLSNYRDVKNFYKNEDNSPDFYLEIPKNS